jgi:glycosyltransferase involved in cell wall biosynthesis
MTKYEENLPLISCLCLTRKRPQLLDRAVRCFKAQTYPNKELLVMYADDDHATGDYIEQNRDDTITPLELSTSLQLNLGQLRNISIERCSGDYFCLWDDDDWYHNARLETQMHAVMQGHKPTCLLTFNLVFDAVADQAYVSILRPWENSILAKKSIYYEGHKYAEMEKGEDTALVLNLIRDNYIFPLVMPNLYIYVYHGQNTWDHKHFNTFYDHKTALSADANKVVKDILADRYSIDEASRLLSSPSFMGGLKYFTVF